MYKTKTLGSLKSIFPPINHPLPLDKRESQRLLESLTKSFRHHLDAEHGWLPEENTSVRTPPPTMTYLPSSASSFPSISLPKSMTAPTPIIPPTTPRRNTDRRPTDRHLRDILFNPLFSYEGRPPAERFDGRLGPDPGHVFQQAVAKGLMTTKRAHGYLLAVRRDMMQSSHLTLKDGLRAAGAGRQVVEWLRSSGKERSLSFTDDVRFTSILAEFLTAEGRDELVWSWLDRLAVRAVQSEADRSPALAAMLRALVDAQALDVELDGAYASMTRGVDMFKAHNAPAANLTDAWRHLAYQSTVESWKHSKPSAGLYESFTAIRETMALPPLRLETAHLDLHHPTRPDSARAVELLQTPGVWSRALHRSAKAPVGGGSGPYDYGARLTSLVLDTVRHLTDRGESEEAQRTLEMVCSTYASFLVQDPLPASGLAS